MTLLRQGLSAVSAIVVALAVTSVSFAEGAEGSRGRGIEGAYIGPPTAEQVAAEEAALAAEAAKAKAAEAAKAKAVVPKQPAWLAARPTQKAATGKNATPTTGRMVGLFIVLATLGAATIYFKRRGKGAPGKLVAAPRRLSVLTSTRIGPKAHAVIISVNGRQMLLGVTDSSVKRLAFIDELEDQAEEEREAPRRATRQSSAGLAAQAVRAAAPEPAQSRSFADLLRTAFKKREPAADMDPASVLAAETRDVVGGKPVTSNVRMLDVEGQAQGLIRRLAAVSTQGPRA
jgi:flagellar biogenesis protein FliO